ncbi:hypothetical protein EYC59_05920, partial [Candidatus Saccharibacteria bacterium]
GPGGGGSSSIGTSTDVTLNNPADNEVLTYDAGTGKWKNAAVSGGGVVPDATATTKGSIQLAGDLGGTAGAPTVPGLAAKADAASLATVASSGNYADLAGKPTIPSAGTTAGTYAAGNDSRLSDTRTPTDGSVTYAKLSAGGATTGQVLGYDGTNLAWSTPSAGTVTSVAGKTGTVTLVKGDVGLGNVDNTSDTNKPVSTATQTALNAKAPLTNPTFIGTVTVPSPSNTTDAANKTYVDTQLGTASFASASVSRTTKTASFTLSLAELGKVIECESSSPITVTVPSHGSVAWPDNTMIELNQTGAGQLTVAAGSGVLLHSPGAPAGLKARTQWSGISLARRNINGATPLPTANLAARWRADDLSGADGSAVSTWGDSSGNGIPAAVQATGSKQPLLRTNVSALGGHKAVEFDGTDDCLTLSGAALNLFKNASYLSVFIVYKLPATAITTGSRTLIGFSTGTSAASQRAAVTTHASGTLYPSLTVRRLDTDAFLGVSNGPALATGHAGVMTSRFLYGTQTMSLYDNGSSIVSNSAAQTAGATSNTASLAAAIGARADATTDYFSGMIAEVIIYNSPDTTSMRTAVESYVQDAYGISVSTYVSGGTDEWIVTGDTTV